MRNMKFGCQSEKYEIEEGRKLKSRINPEFVSAVHPQIGNAQRNGVKYDG